MKLVRYGEKDNERPGVWMEMDGAPHILDVRGMAFDIHDFDGFFFSHFGLERLASLEKERPLKVVPAANMRLGPPVARPGKIICVGKNYADHAREFDSVVPESPVLFGKAVTSLNGPFDPIVIAPDATSTDAEVELAVVIGKIARHVAERDALAFVAGYTVLNDVTDRIAQKEGLQWYRGKSFDTFCPVGPWLVTPDEFDPSAGAALRSRLNGEVLQQGHTRDLMFGIACLISFISQQITLAPGDIIATGTPAGVGFARKPPVLLKSGDRIECEIDGIGTISNPVIAEHR